MPWYDLQPSDYARGLRYSADRSDECATRQMADGKPWSGYEVERFHRQARRLRAMALLCDRSTAARAGDIDFLGLMNPAQSREDEDAAIASILNCEEPA